MRTYNFYDLCLFLETEGKYVRRLLNASGICEKDVPTEWAKTTKRILFGLGEERLYTSRAINTIKDTPEWQELVTSDRVGSYRCGEMGRYKTSTQKRKGLLG